MWFGVWWPTSTLVLSDYHSVRLDKEQLEAQAAGCCFLSTLPRALARLGEEQCLSLDNRITNFVFYQKFSLGFLGRSFPLMTAMHTIGASRWQDLFNDVPPWWHHSIDFPTGTSGTSGTSGTRHCLFVMKYDEVVFVGAMPAIPLAMPTSGSLSDFLAASWTVAQSTPSMPTSRQVGSFTAGRDCFGD